MKSKNIKKPSTVREIIIIIIIIMTCSFAGIVVDVVPSVIEPSFGIGRILYAILEHNFHKREGDEMRSYLTLPPVIAPIGCSVLPLSGNKQFDPYIKTIGTV